VHDGKVLAADQIQQKVERAFKSLEEYFQRIGRDVKVFGQFGQRRAVDYSHRLDSHSFRINLLRTALLRFLLRAVDGRISWLREIGHLQAGETEQQALHGIDRKTQNHGQPAGRDQCQQNEETVGLDLTEFDGQLRWQE